MTRMLRYCFVISLMLFTLSCERLALEDQPTADGDITGLVNEAKSYFDSQLNTLNARGKTSDSFLPASWRDKKPQWDQAITFKSEGKDVVEVPLLYGTVDPVYKLTSDDPSPELSAPARNGTSKALFFKQKDGTIRAYIMKLIATADFYEKNKKDKKYKKISFSTATKNFSGLMLLSSWDERLLSIYQFKEGKIIAGTASKSSKKSSPNGRGCGFVLNCRWWCISFPNPCCTPEEDAYNPTGYCCGNGDENRICGPSCLESFVCYPDAQPTEPVNGPGGGGNDDNGGNDSEPQVAEIDISGLSNECMINAYNKVMDAGLSSTVLEIAKNLGKATNVRIEIENGSLDKGTNGQARLVNKAFNVWVITLNYNDLANASQEYIAITILHEMLHVYLAGGNDSDHNVMAEKYVKPLADAIKYAGYALSYDDAIALAWGGLQGAKVGGVFQTYKAWQDLLNTDRITGSHVTNDIIKKNNDYKYNNYGVRCN